VELKLHSHHTYLHRYSGLITVRGYQNNRPLNRECLTKSSDVLAFAGTMATQFTGSISAEEGGQNTVGNYQSSHENEIQNVFHNSFTVTRGFPLFNAAQAGLQALMRLNLQSRSSRGDSTSTKSPKPKEITRRLSSRFDASRARLQVLMDPDFQSRLSTEDIARINNLMLSCLASNAVLSAAIPLINRNRRLDAHVASHAHTVRLHLEDLETHIEVEEERLQR
jgi:hypothetical protein